MNRCRFISICTPSRPRSAFCIAFSILKQIGSERVIRILCRGLERVKVIMTGKLFPWYGSLIYFSYHVGGNGMTGWYPLFFPNYNTAVLCIKQVGGDNHHPSPLSAFEHMCRFMWCILCSVPALHRFHLVLDFGPCGSSHSALAAPICHTNHKASTPFKLGDVSSEDEVREEL